MFPTTLTRSSNGHVRRILIATLAALLLFTTLALIPGAPLGADPAHATTSVTPITDFEIDGNLTREAGGDWRDDYGAGRTANDSYPTTGIYYNHENTDVCGMDTDDVAVRLTGGAKVVKLGEGPIWPTGAGAPNPSKGDLKAVWVGAEKIDVSGQINDMLYLAFELCNEPGPEFQVALALEGPDGTPPFSPADNPSGSTDDLLIVFNFEPSTGTGTALIHTFDGTQWSSSTTVLPGTSWEASVLPGGKVGEVAINLTTAGLLPEDSCSAITVSDQVATINGNSLQSAANDIVSVEPITIENCGDLKVAKISEPDVPGAGPFTYFVIRFPSGTVSDSSLDTSGVNHPLVVTDELLNAAINVGQTDTWGNVISGANYTIGELVDLSGWELDTISCTFTDIFQSPLASETVTIYENGAATDKLFLVPPNTFPPGAIETTTCTIMNATSGVIVEKAGAGDTATVFPFDINGEKLKITGTEVDGLKLAETSDATPFTPGTTVTVTETLPSASPAWTHTATTCTFDDGSTVPVTGDLLNPTFDTVAGKVITCTFENNQAAKIIVEKQTLPDGSLTFFPFSGDLESLGGIQDGDTIEKEVAPGTYTSTETPPNGWDLTDISCDDPNSSGDLATDTATFNVVAGQTVKCTFTNTETPTLALTKVVVNLDGGDAAATEWSLGAAGDGGITPTHGIGTSLVATVGPEDVKANVTYTLSESGPAGYAAGDWSCTITPAGGTAGASVDGDTITLGPGESGSCIITNDDIAPTLKLVKTVDTDDGGDAVADYWTLTAVSRGADASRDISTLGGSGTVDDVFANTVYDLAEIGPPGYLAGDWSCVGGTQTNDTIELAPGQSAVCTINNDDIAPTLKLVKTVTKDNGGIAVADDWTLTAVSQGADASRDISTLGGSGTTDDVFAHTVYDLAETGPDGYTPGDWSCVGGTQVGSTIKLAPGHSSVCTINNDDDPASLILAKTVVNDNGGDAVVSNWTLFINQGISGEFSVTGSTGGAEVTNKAGTYTLSEVGTVAGYSLDSLTCDNNPDVEVTSVTIGLGETIKCTFVNDDDAPGLTLIKHVVNDDGGDATADQWTLSAGAHDVEGSEAGVLATDQTGTYALSETALAGYTNTSITCDNAPDVEVVSVTVGLGENIACTFVNDDVAPTLNLFKQVVNDHGGTAVPADWNLLATSTSTDGDFALPASHVILPLTFGSTTAQDVFANNEYTLSETGTIGHTDDYTQDGPWSCVVTDVAGVKAPAVESDTITLTEGESADCVVVNDDDVAELTLVKHVVNDNGGTSVAADWTLKTTSTSGFGDISALADQNTTDAGLTGDTDVHEVHANNVYTLSEMGTVDYTQVGMWSCVIDGADPVLSNTIELAHGATATCTATNDDDAVSLILVKDVVNDNGGTAVPSAWDLYIEEGTAGEKSVPGTISGLEVTDQAGTFNLSESMLGGYTNTLITCDNLPASVPPGTPVTEVTIGLGETVTCTFTNDDDVPSLLLQKTVVNDNGGNGVASDWTLSAGSNHVTGSATPVEATDQAGTYALSESVEPGYAQTSLTCSDDPGVEVTSVTVGLGETITCTFVNDDLPAGIDIEKATNGFDADDPTGPYIHVGNTVTWTYVVTNTGQADLEKILVEDSDRSVSVSCTGSTLAVGASMACTATGIAVAGQYENTGHVFGTAVTGAAVEDSDMSHYFGSDPAIGVTKDVLPAVINVGEATEVTWTIVVSNAGNVALTDVAVTDALVADCDNTVGDLAVGGSSTYTCNSTHTPDNLAWTFTNVAVATGVGPAGTQVTAEDDAKIDPIDVGGSAQGGDTVWLDKNKNGVQDADEPGINGAKVTLKDSAGNVIATAITAKGAWDGFYKFLELDAGTYTFELDQSSVSGQLTTASSFTVTIVDGEDYTLADFGVAEVLPVTGMDSAALALVGLAMLAAGAVALLFSRRKREDG